MSAWAVRGPRPLTFGGRNPSRAGRDDCREGVSPRSLLPPERFPTSIPPLRERPEGIPLLLRHFVRQFAQRMNKIVDSISSETMEALTRYPWSGNIRELQNVVERAVVLYEKGSLSVKKSWLSDDCFQNQPAIQPFFRRSAAEDRRMIDSALAETRGRVSGPSGAAEQARSSAIHSGIEDQIAQYQQVSLQDPSCRRGARQDRNAQSQLCRMKGPNS